MWWKIILIFIMLLGGVWFMEDIEDHKYPIARLFLGLLLFFGSGGLIALIIITKQ